MKRLSQRQPAQKQRKLRKGDPWDVETHLSRHASSKIGIAVEQSRFHSRNSAFSLHLAKQV